MPRRGAYGLLLSVLFVAVAVAVTWLSGRIAWWVVLLVWGVRA